MPRLTNRPTGKSLEKLHRRLNRIFEELQPANEQLFAWSGATEKIERWAKDIQEASAIIGMVEDSMRMILERDSRESLEDERYSFE